MRSTREVLVRVATALLDEGGVAAVTLREVGRRAGVSHNAPYKHFADKEDMLAAVAAAELRRARDSVRRIRRGRSAIESAPLMLHMYVRRARTHPERFKLTYGPWRNGSEELAEAADDARLALEQTIGQAQESGDLPAGDAEQLTALLLALAHGAADLALAGHLARDGKGHADPDDLIDALFAYLTV